MDTQTLAITTNATSNKLTLLDGWNKISINYAAGAAGTITPQFHRFATSTAEGIQIPAPVSGTSTTANITFDLSGPGLIDFASTGVSGTINVSVDWMEQDRSLFV